MANNIALFQDQMKRFGVVTVMDAVFYEYGTPKPVLMLDTLKVSSISMDGSNKDIRGGMAADLLIQYYHSRTISLEITDALVSLESLQTLWGTKAQSLQWTRGQAKVKANGSTLTIPSQFIKPVEYSGSPTAADVNDISVFDVTAKTWLAPSGSSYNVTSGQEYIIYGYVAAVASDNPAEIVLKSTTFPSALTLVGRTVFLNEDGKQVLAEIEIPKFQFGNAFDFAMDAEGDASTFNFSGTALAAGDEKELIKIKTLKTGATGESVMDHAWDDVVIG